MTPTGPKTYNSTFLYATKNQFYTVYAQKTFEHFCANNLQYCNIQTVPGNRFVKRRVYFFFLGNSKFQNFKT